MLTTEVTPSKQKREVKKKNMLEVKQATVARL